MTIKAALHSNQPLERLNGSLSLGGSNRKRQGDGPIVGVVTFDDETVRRLRSCRRRLGLLSAPIRDFAQGPLANRAGQWQGPRDATSQNVGSFFFCSVIH